jgi:hypothetical protein
VPLIIAAVKSTEALVVAEAASDAPWVSLLAAYAVIFLVASTLTFEYVVEE